MNMGVIRRRQLQNMTKNTIVCLSTSYRFARMIHRLCTSTIYFSIQ